MLSPAAEQVCSQHYGGWQAKVNGCHRCPLRDQCITMKPTTTGQDLQAWQGALNDAAAKWLADQEERKST